MVICVKSSPTGTAHAYYALYGWAPGAGLTAEQVPGPNTVWTVASGNALTPDTSITLEWNNGAGLIFERVVSVERISEDATEDEDDVDGGGEPDVGGDPQAGGDGDGPSPTEDV